MFIVCILFTAGLLLPTPATAEEVFFDTNLQILYLVTEKNTVIVEHRIKLANRTANQYSTEYHLSVHGNITHITAFDQFGTLQPRIESDLEKSLIVVPFETPVVGEGKERDFTVSYTLNSLLERNGEVWEINLPPLPHINGLTAATVSLTVPYDIGPLAYLTPEPTETTSANERRTYSFSGELLAERGVNAAFGECQIFSFELKYHLQNPYATPGKTEISLPPDTAYQQVYITKLKPSPDKTYFDPDGNLIAVYELKRRESLEVIAEGTAILVSQPRENYPRPDEETIQANLRPQPYWESNHESIIALAKDLQEVKPIYDFVVQLLTYDEAIADSQISRKGALGALDNPQHALCMEFTDLFIAIARAAGIPAREAIGFAYTNKADLKTSQNVIDILHSWPEYWDSQAKRWIPVDPTWENTTLGRDYFHKLDLNHFVFTYHGTHSEKPVPAGSYKTGTEIGKDVQIYFSQWPVFEDQPLKVEISQLRWLFQKPTVTATLYNPGPAGRYQQAVKLELDNVRIPSTFWFPSNVLALAPFESKTILIQLEQPKIWEVGQARIGITAGNASAEYHFRKEVLTLPWLLIAAAIISLAAIVLLWRTRRRKKTTLPEKKSDKIQSR